MKKTYFIAAMLGLVLFNTSCRKLIEVPDTDSIAGDLALSQIGFVEQAMLGAYASITPNMNILLNATFADEVVRSEFYNASTTHEWQYGPGDIGLRDNFTALGINYAAINRVNVALRALPKADSTKVGDEQLRIRLRGEGLFLRAYAHFELFRYYCDNYTPTGIGMAYMDVSSISPSPRIDMGTYFQKLKADLTTARTLVPDNLTDINRANVAAIAGLQARVALYMRDYAAAETFATDYITRVPLATIALFPGIWTDANNAEQAYRVVNTSTIGSRIGSLFRGTSASSANIGVVTWAPSDKLWSSYNQITDVRFNSYLMNETLLSNAGRLPRLIKKYAGGPYGAPNENVANGKMMRTAEMVLIRAEARAELERASGANSAESDVNLLRSNRITGYVPVVYASKQQAIDDILLERFKELAYEGHRFFDIKRRGLAVNRTTVDAPSPEGTNLAAGNFRFLLPIPLPERVANPGFVQNPGYQ